MALHVREVLRPSLALSKRTMMSEDAGDCELIITQETGRFHVTVGHDARFADHDFALDFRRRSMTKVGGFR